MICLAIFLFFFFKQKTAYEMRISDWSSDVALPIWVTNQPAVHPAVLEKSLVHHFGTSVGPTVVDAVGAVFRHERDRKSVVWGKSVSVRVDLGGRRIIKKKNRKKIK